MENIYTSSKPFYNLVKLLGLFPMSYDGPVHKGILEVKHLDIISTIISMSLCVFLFCLGLIFEDGAVSTSKFLSQVFVVHHLCANVLIFFNAVYQTSKYRSIAKFLVAIETFDLKVIF